MFGHPHHLAGGGRRLLCRGRTLLPGRGQRGGILHRLAPSGRTGHPGLCRAGHRAHLPRVHAASAHAGPLRLCRGLDGLPIKLLEFNADTPFSIFEVSSLQYALAKHHELDPDHFQYNSLFEQLRDFFLDLLPAHAGRGVLFTNAADGEDDLNTLIIKDAAEHAGLTGTYLHWTDVCIDRERGLCSVDKSGTYIEKIFHLMIKMVP